MDELLKQLDAMKKAFMKEFDAAPLYGGYSKVLRMKIEGKNTVRDDFISSVRMFGVLNPEISDKVAAILKGFEKL
jgi:hypothetical protein